MKPDWTAIRADFLATGASYSSLAKKWNVPLSTVKKRAMREKWATGFSRVVKKTEPLMEPVPTEMELRPEMEPVPNEEPEAELVPTEQYAAELRANRCRRMIEATDAMMDRVINALEIIEPDNTYALMTLVKSLKDIREMQGLNKSALDIEEQRLRIEKMKREARADEENREITVSIRGMSDEEIREVLG